MENDIYDIIDELLFKDCYLIDIFPRQISKERKDRYFALEEFYSDEEEIELIGRKFLNVILKLYAYYDFEAVMNDNGENITEFDDIVEEIRGCYETGRGDINIVMNNGNSLLSVYGDSLYMCLYAPDEEMLELVSSLAASEGLFFRRAPEE